jgi:hypothetical protein
MQYSPKLKTAMEEIKAILKKHDIAALVVLHSPGFIEYVNRLETNYSCAFVSEGEFRVRLKTSEVGKERAKELAEGTYNMINMMTDIIAMHAKGYMDFEEMLREHWGGIGGSSSHHTSHDQQNN